MTTFLFEQHVFGPVKSRRLGVSLGINLLSTEEKICNFDCVYCECGLTKDKFSDIHKFVNISNLLEELGSKLKEMELLGEQLDTVTFAGNGEPTLHPLFYEIVKGVVELRDVFFPKTNIAVLSNGTTIHKNQVKEALALVDMAIIKLDAGFDEGIESINRPKGKFVIDNFVHALKNIDHPIIIQSMFLKGQVNGEFFDNTDNRSMGHWLQQLYAIQPSEVMIYSLDRDTAINGPEKISDSKLEKIAEKVRGMGIRATAY